MAEIVVGVATAVGAVVAACFLVVLYWVVWRLFR